MKKEQLQQITADYIVVFPTEAERIVMFRQFLERNNDGNLYDRRNFDGHITTSAFILNATGDSMLLLQHKSLKKWLQPGGHVEADATLVAAALREVKEETNIGGEWLQLLPVPGNVPFDIDAHFIPANPKKQEEGHYHYDIRYLFRFTGNEQEIIHSRDEATGIGWFKMTELEHSPIFGDMVKKIALML